MDKMSLFHQFLKSFKNPREKPCPVPKPAPDSEKAYRNQVEETHHFPNGLPTIDLLDLVPDFNVKVDPYSFLEGTSTVLDIALLNALAGQRPGCRYLEIGAWKGESVANVSKFADQCVSISLSGAEMKAIGLSDEFIRVHNFFSNGLANVKHIAHNSHTFDFSTLAGKFDLIFIDGDHTYQGVKTDTRNVFNILKDDRSVIVWHDYGTTPERVSWEVVAGMLDGCPPDNRKHLYHVSNTLCGIYIRSPFTAKTSAFPQTPDKTFEITISAKRL
jgi:hypothetical protein